LVHLKGYLFIQWGALTFLSIGQLSYYLHYRPIVDREMNNLEVMNEICLLLTLYFIALFSDMVVKPAIQYEFGFLFIGCQGLLLLINQLVVFKTIYNILRLKCKKRAAQKKAKAAGEKLKKAKAINGDEVAAKDNVSISSRSSGLPMLKKVPTLTMPEISEKEDEESEATNDVLAP
jgi:hypothetical protein